jgi:hypothetical protein
VTAKVYFNKPCNLLLSNMQPAQRLTWVTTTKLYMSKKSKVIFVRITVTRKKRLELYVVYWAALDNPDHLVDQSTPFVGLLMSCNWPCLLIMQVSIRHVTTEHITVKLVTITAWVKDQFHNTVSIEAPVVLNLKLCLLKYM